MRRLIVNADDFGYTAGVNQGIVKAHTHGIVTSTTLMATGPAFDDAVRLAKQLPNLSVGCHVVLIDGEPVLDPAHLRTMTSSAANPARFRDGLKSFAARALTGRLDANELEGEITAQIRKIQAAGITVSHVDSHKHTHLIPAVLHPMLRAARACGISAIRNPFGPSKPLRSGDLLTRPSLWTRTAEARLLRAFAAKFSRAAAQAGLMTPDGTLGVVVTGALDEKVFRAMAAIIPEGTWELVCHPGYNDAALQIANTRLRDSRETELRVLTMPGVRQLLNSSGIELIPYHEFVSGKLNLEVHGKY